MLSLPLPSALFLLRTVAGAAHTLSRSLIFQPSPSFPDAVLIKNARPLSLFNWCANGDHWMIRRATTAGSSQLTLCSGFLDNRRRR